MDKSYVGMTSCFLCGEAKDVLLDRRMRDTLPRQAVYDLEPCQKCKSYMEAGIILISFDESKTDFTDTIELPNPEYDRRKGHTESDKTYDTGLPNFHRTGGWCVLKEDAVLGFPVDDRGILMTAVEKRLLFLPDQAWDAWGLPRNEEINNLEAANNGDM